MNDNQPAPFGFTYYGKDPYGVEIALTTPAYDVEELRKLCDDLKAAGFQRSDRLEPRSFGGGNGFNKQQRQIVPPPPDVEIPTELHCGVAWEYKPEKPGSDDRPGYPAHWECGKGRNCEKPRTNNGRNYPAELRVVKKKQASKESARGSAPAPAAQGSAAPASLGYGEFKTLANQQYGMFTSALLKFAGVKDEAALRAAGEPEWLRLLDAMKAEKAATAA